MTSPPWRRLRKGVPGRKASVDTLDRLRGEKPRLSRRQGALRGKRKGGGRALRRKPLLSSAGGSATHLPGLDPEGQDPIQQETQEVAKGCPGLALVPPRGEGSTRTSPASACGPGTLLRPAGLRSLALAHLAILFILDIICYFPQHGVRRPPKQSPVKSRLPPPPER